MGVNSVYVESYIILNWLLKFYTGQLSCVLPWDVTKEINMFSGCKSVFPFLAFDIGINLEILSVVETAKHTDASDRI